MARKVKVGTDSTAVKNATKLGVVITPEQLAASGTEHGHQAAIMQWIALHGRSLFQDVDLIHAIPNGGDRSASVGAQMKAEGVKRGVPDMMLPVPWARYPGLYIELKVPGVLGNKNGGRSDEQVKWHQRLRKQGYAVVTAYGWQAAILAIAAYYHGRLRMPEDGDAYVMAGISYDNVTVDDLTKAG